MFLTVTLSMLFILALLMAYATSPAMLGMLVLTFASVTTCLISAFVPSWFSLAVFLVYLGGLLVMFSYFMALAPNQYHAIPVKQPTKTVMMAMMLTPLAVALIPPIPSLESITPATSLTLIFLPENLLTLIFIVTILFVALLAVVKSVSVSQGPLRPFYGTQP